MNGRREEGGKGEEGVGGAIMLLLSNHWTSAEVQFTSKGQLLVLSKNSWMDSLID